MLQLLQLAEKLKPTTILLWGEPLCCSRGKFISHTYLLQSTCCSFYLFMLMYLPIWVGILSVLSSMYIDTSPCIPVLYRYQCIICMNHHTFTYINVWSMWTPLLFALSPLPTYLPCYVFIWISRAFPRLPFLSLFASLHHFHKSLIKSKANPSDEEMSFNYFHIFPTKKGSIATAILKAGILLF